MIIILTIICLVLLFYLNKNDEDRKAEKTINQRETEKINLLRENNILNKNYSKAEKICNKIINRFPGSSQNIDKRFKLYITQSTIFYIVARGFVLDNTKLSMRWDWSETENLITLKINNLYLRQLKR